MSGYTGWRDADVAKLGANVRPAPKRSKYRAVPHCVLPDMRVIPETECAAAPGRIRFASKREALRFVELRILMEDGQISDLLLQEQFALHAMTPQGVKVQVGTCRMDFTYTKNGQRIREDSKGENTNEAYRQRKRHVEVEYGITVLET